MYYLYKLVPLCIVLILLVNLKKFLLLVLWIYVLYYECNYCYKTVLEREIERRYKEKEGAIFIKADNLN